MNDEGHSIYSSFNINLTKFLTMLCQPVYMIKTNVAFLRAGFFPANQSFLNTF